MTGKYGFKSYWGNQLRGENMQFSKDLVLIDLETTAGDTIKADICEIGAIFICRKSLFILDEFSSLAKPTRDYREPKAMEVHGIPEEDLQKAPELSIMFDNFEQWVRKNLIKQKTEPILRNVMLGAWGTNFDISVLQNQYRLIKKEYPFHYRVIDLKSILYYEFARMEKGISRKSGLQNVSKTLQIPFAGVHHRALDDIKQSLRILQCLALRR